MKSHHMTPLSLKNKICYYLPFFLLYFYLLTFLSLLFVLFQKVTFQFLRWICVLTACDLEESFVIESEP